jgi:hypothetical protein
MLSSCSKLGLKFEMHLNLKIENQKFHFFSSRATATDSAQSQSRPASPRARARAAPPRPRPSRPSPSSARALARARWRSGRARTPRGGRMPATAAGWRSVAPTSASAHALTPPAQRLAIPPSALPPRLFTERSCRFRLRHRTRSPDARVPTSSGHRRPLHLATSFLSLWRTPCSPPSPAVSSTAPPIARRSSGRAHRGSPLRGNPASASSFPSLARASCSPPPPGARTPSPVPPRGRRGAPAGEQRRRAAMAGGKLDFELLRSCQ